MTEDGVWIWGQVVINKNSPGGRYSQKPLELTSTLVLKVASNLSWALKDSNTVIMGQGWWVRAQQNPLCMCLIICHLPVVKQYIRCPDLVWSETEVLNSRILWLVPLEVVIVPLLGDTSTRLVLHMSNKGSNKSTHRHRLDTIFHSDFPLGHFTIVISVYSVHSVLEEERGGGIPLLLFLRFLRFLTIIRFFLGFLFLSKPGDWMTWLEISSSVHWPWKGRTNLHWSLHVFKYHRAEVTIIMMLKPSRHLGWYCASVPA